MDIVKVFGTNLKKYRMATGLSQEAFSDKFGMHRTYISAIEYYRCNNCNALYARIISSIIVLNIYFHAVSSSIY